MLCSEVQGEWMPSECTRKPSLPTSLLGTVESILWIENKVRSSSTFVIYYWFSHWTPSFTETQTFFSSFFFFFVWSFLEQFFEESLELQNIYIVHILFVFLQLSAKKLAIRTTERTQRHNGTILHKKCANAKCLRIMNGLQTNTKNENRFEEC